MFPFLFGLYQFINAFNRNTPSIIKNIGTIKQGLSLIVVDDALVRRLQGWCTRHLKVSILVVLDDALVQSCILRKMPTWCVSILVVLDDALVPCIPLGMRYYVKRLNPCCAGRCSSTRETETILIINMLQNYAKVIFAFLNQKLTIS